MCVFVCVRSYGSLCVGGQPLYICLSWSQFHCDSENDWIKDRGVYLCAYGHMLKNSDSGLNGIKRRLYIRGLNITKRSLKLKAEKGWVFLLYSVFSHADEQCSLGQQCSSNSSSGCIFNVISDGLFVNYCNLWNRMSMCVYVWGQLRNNKTTIKLIKKSLDFNWKGDLNQISRD